MRTPGQALRDRRPLVIAGVAALLLATAWFFALGPGARILSPKGSAVAEFDGSGDLTTTSFTVRDGWEIHWTSESEAFTLAIRGDRNLGTVVDGAGTGLGVTSPPVGGTFHLEITAGSSWSVTVVQGD
jgi:hypothetical protein